MTAQPLKSYLLKRPAGAHPRTLKITVERAGEDGSVESRTFDLPWDTVFRASATCDPDWGVANLSHNPPLLRVEIIDRMPQNFQCLDCDPDTPDNTNPTDEP